MVLSFTDANSADAARDASRRAAGDILSPRDGGSCSCKSDHSDSEWRLTSWIGPALAGAVFWIAVGLAVARLW